MEPIEAQAAQVDRWYTNAKGTRVQVKAILHEGVVVEKAPGQTTTVPLTYPLTPVEEAAPTVGGITAADLAGRPKPLVEASLASLPTDQLLELSRLDSRIWLGVEIERLLKRRQTEAPAAPAAAAPTPAAQKPPETGWCLVCGSEVGVRKPMTVKAHMNAIGGACTGVGTKALDHAPTDADREAEDEVGEQAWREGRPIPDMDDEGRPRPLAADGWTRARDYWRSCAPQVQVRNAPTVGLALQVLGQHAEDLGREELLGLVEDLEMDSPEFAPVRAEVQLLLKRLALGPKAPVAQEPQDPAPVASVPSVEKSASNADGDGPAPPAGDLQPQLQERVEPAIFDDRWSRELPELLNGAASVVKFELGENRDLQVYLDAQAAELAGRRRLALLGWLEARIKAKGGTPHLPLAKDLPRPWLVDGPAAKPAEVPAATSERVPEPSVQAPPVFVLAHPDVAAVTAFQDRLERLQAVVRALRDLVPYVVAANQLCEEAGDLGLVVDIQDLVECRLNAD